MRGSQSPLRAAGTSAETDPRAGIVKSLSRAIHEDDPFPHLRLRHLLTAPIMDGLIALPFTPTALDGGSGRRELHNDQRIYFTPAVIDAHPAAARVARLFQDAEVVAALAEAAEAPLHKVRLRIEYALDIDGFWLEPHTDLGVKALSLLIPLPVGRRQVDLGTDLYRAPGIWARRAAFARGAALAFRPSDRSWHGFEPRPIRGVRRSLIVNYVTPAWRSREQLAYPDQPVGGSGRGD